MRPLVVVVAAAAAVAASTPDPVAPPPCPNTNATTTLPVLDAGRRRAIRGAWCASLGAWCRIGSYGELGGRYAQPTLTTYCGPQYPAVDGMRSVPFPPGESPRRAGDRKRRTEPKKVAAALRCNDSAPAGMPAGPACRSAAPRADAYAKRMLRFVHVPKTGGTSVEQAFEQSFPKNHALAYDRKDLGGPSVSTVAVIRDPYDRALSWFRFCIAGFNGNLPHPIAHCAKARSLRRAADNAPPGNATALAFEAWLALVFGDAAYANLWVTTPLVVYLTHPATGDFLVQSVLRFETLAADVARWCAPRGCAARAAALADIHANPSALGGARRADPFDQPYAPLYTRRAREIVDGAWGVDADVFDYPFGGARRR